MLRKRILINTCAHQPCAEGIETEPETAETFITLIVPDARKLLNLYSMNNAHALVCILGLGTRDARELS